MIESQNGLALCIALSGDLHRDVDHGIVLVRDYSKQEPIMHKFPGGQTEGRKTAYVIRHELADETGLAISVCHFPPGTSKWNKIEHRLFSFLTQNWRGKPLHTRAAIVNLIAATQTRTGLTVRCVLDTRHYPKAVKVSDAQMQQLRLFPHAFHGEWNYTLKPHAS